MLQTYKAKVSSIDQVSPKVYRFRFQLTEPQTVSFTAGQYLLLDVNGAYRQYSISSSPSQNTYVETAVDITPMGLGSKYLMGLKKGEEVSFRAPLGMFTLKKTGAPVVFLATGTGVVPLKSMIHQLTEDNYPQPYKLIWGLRERRSIYFDKEWQEIRVQNPNFDYLYCLSREENPDGPRQMKGHVQDALAALSPEELGRSEFYICGRFQTVEDLKGFLIDKLKIHPDRLNYEKFT